MSDRANARNSTVTMMIVNANCDESNLHAPYVENYEVEACQNISWQSGKGVNEVQR